MSHTIVFSSNHKFYERKKNNDGEKEEKKITQPEIVSFKLLQLINVSWTRNFVPWNFFGRKIPNKFS